MGGRWKSGVLWEKTGEDRHGEPTLADKVEIRARFEFKRKDAVGDDGQTIALDATADVDREIEIGSLIAPGDLEDWTDVGTGDVWATGHIYRVAIYNEEDDEKGRDPCRWVGLQRFRGDIPGD
jgi:hypothetical protein